jgi:hypothetical protein
MNMKRIFFAALCTASWVVHMDAFARSSPVTPQLSKDFKNFIVQGERPEVSACLASSLSLIKKNKYFKNFSFLDAHSERALMREKEIDGELIRTIELRTQAIESGPSFFDTYTDVQIQCEQKNQGNPLVRVTILK